MVSGAFDVGGVREALAAGTVAAIVNCGQEGRYVYGFKRKKAVLRLSSGSFRPRKRIIASLTPRNEALENADE